MNEIETLVTKIIEKIKQDYGSQCAFLSAFNDSSGFSDQLVLLLNFLMNEKFNKVNECNQCKRITYLISQLQLLVDDCPSSPETFIKWLPKFISKQNKTIYKIQERVTKLQNQVKDLLNQMSIHHLSINSQNNELNKSDSLMIKKLEKKIVSLKNKLSQYESNDQQKEIDALKQQLLKEQMNSQELISIEKEKEKKCHDLQQKLNILKKENENNEENYNKIFSKLNGKIYLLKQKLQQNNERDDNNSKIIKLELKLENSQKENQQLFDNLTKYKSELNEQKLKMKSINSLNLTINSLKSKNKNLKEELLSLRNANMNLKQTININSDLMTKNSDLLNKNIEYKMNIKQLKSENQKLTDEINELRGLSSSSILETIGKLTQENEELKRNFFNHIEKVKNEEDIHILTNTVQILKKENENLTEQNHLLTFSLSESSSNSNLSSNSDLISNNILLNTNEKEINKLIAKEKEIQCLKKKLVVVETEKLKLGEVLRKIQNSKRDTFSIDVKRFGFLLADALCQHFNPAQAKNEVERLIEVARSEHIKLSETTRIPLDPFHVFDVNKNSENLGNSDEQRRKTETKNSVLFSKFDELASQITALKNSNI
ncbi:hypothetical protein TRFO_20978 [Tritrichomonas foetus]|uniref:Uncharacterized protein n=1 Tax=Tritrichomonas foetus TaxID=1144522 RepID=A0A1J4KEX4_9EUKA|nr:hypothetical protein TRFO_20978 [Tritrichomonas foetus]|eukprot:OHT09983.1 hypothetical protein TRFO_20978 [Tritrichomonas foetus]